MGGQKAQAGWFFEGGGMVSVRGWIEEGEKVNSGGVGQVG